MSSKYSFETHLLIELNPNGELLKVERFFHGNYPCCWNNYYDGFKKFGNCFGLMTCGTGSGHCSSYLYLFNDIFPQDQQNSILIESWFGGEGDISQSVSSEIEFKEDKLVLNYKLENGELDDDLNFIVKETKKFDVNYYFKNNRWVTNDSTLFKILN